MFEKKKKAAKNEDLMKEAPAAGAVELGDDVLEAAAGGDVVWSDGRCTFDPRPPRILLPAYPPPTPRIHNTPSDGAVHR